MSGLDAGGESARDAGDTQAPDAGSPSGHGDAGETGPRELLPFAVLDARDMAAHDDMLYVASSDGHIYRHRLTSDSPDPEPLQLESGSSPNGLDISPDGKWLVAAESKLHEDASGSWIAAHVIALETGEVRRVNLASADANEWGAFMPMFIDAHTVLVSVGGSSEGESSCRLLTLDVLQKAQESSEWPCVSRYARLGRSADGKAGLAAGTSEQGRLSRHNLENRTTSESWTNVGISEVALSRDGSQLAAVTGRGLVIEGAPYERTLLGAAAMPALGVAYDPNFDVLYVAWDATKGWFINAYDTRTWKPTRIIDRSTPIDVNNLASLSEFGEGHLRVSHDGRFLFAKAPGVVRIYELGAQADGDAGSIPERLPSDSESPPDWPEHPEHMFAFAPARGALDAVHDASRRQLYISTYEAGLRGRVIRWDMSWDSDGGVAPGPDQDRLLGHLPIDGFFESLDLSPSQARLVATDADPAPSAIVVQVVELASGSARRLALPKRDVEVGAHAAVFLDEQTLLVASSAIKGTDALVPLRRVDLRDGSAKEIAQVGSSADMSRSADGEKVLVTWRGSSGLLRYDVATGAVDGFSIAGDTFDVAVDRAGAQAALLSDDPGTFIYDQNGSLLETLNSTIASGTRIVPQRALYSPVSDVLFLCWQPGREEFQRPVIGAYDANTFQQLVSLETEPTYPTHLRSSRDGTRLFVVDTLGAAIYDSSSFAH